MWVDGCPEIDEALEMMFEVIRKEKNILREVQNLTISSIQENETAEKLILDEKKQLLEAQKQKLKLATRAKIVTNNNSE